MSGLRTPEVWAKLTGLGLGLAVGAQAATEMFAWTYQWADALGPAWRIGPHLSLYPPWAILQWRSAFGAEAQAVMSRCVSLILVFGVGGLGLGTLAGDTPHRRIRGWGKLKDAQAAGLTAVGGCILGVLGRKVLATTDLRPSLITGGTRSGKGRGHEIGRAHV